MNELLAVASELWAGFGAETKSALIQGGFTVIAATLGAIAIGRQISAQGKHSREVIIESEKRKLRTVFYEEALAVVTAETSASSDYSAWLRGLELEIRVQRAMLDTGQPSPALKRKHQAMSDLSGKHSDAAIELVFLIERRLIIDPRLALFKFAFVSAIHDIRESQNCLNSMLLTVLPVALPDGREVIGHEMTKTEAEAVLAEIACCIKAILKLNSWSSDMLVELQNALLGDVFGQRLEHRKPLDPDELVIDFVRFEFVEARLKATPWGILEAKINEETAALFDARR